MVATFPHAWDKVASFVLDLSEIHDADQVAKDHPPFDFLLSMDFSPVKLYALKMQMLWHVLGSLGLSQYNKKSDEGTSPVAYMSFDMHFHICTLQKKFDLSTPSSAA